MDAHINILLTGNPNSGKTSLFNALTGMNQKVGNFAGVTVDKKTGSFQVDESITASITDLPGTYSLYPKSHDEQVAYSALMQEDGQDCISIVLVDASNLKRSLFFCTQIIDLQRPVIVALSMVDTAQKREQIIDNAQLSKILGVPVVAVNPRQGTGLDTLKAAIKNSYQNKLKPSKQFYQAPTDKQPFLLELPSIVGGHNLYQSLHRLHLLEHSPKESAMPVEIGKWMRKNQFKLGELQGEEVLDRYQQIDGLLNAGIIKQSATAKKQHITQRIDKVLLHPFWGSIILLCILLLIFQSIFLIASYPMDWIDAGFAGMTGYLHTLLPDAWWANLLTDGILAGIGGIVIFVPQIAILFLLITLLEDTGYMARISFLMDRLFRTAGLTGKSVMPLMSAMACAIPAVMAARTIEQRRQRLVTILIAPLMSCSARLPIYAIFIALIVPEKYYFGFIGLQGLVLMAMYLLGFVMAMIVSKIIFAFKKNTGSDFFLMELPTYQIPRWRNAVHSMLQKSKVFLWEAGRVIIVISIILWVLSSYGPSRSMQAVADRYAAQEAAQAAPLSQQQLYEQSTDKLEASYAGRIGHFIEPAIRPLGYDWKMGIALLTSFAAREVFVGTMATLYSVGEADENSVPLKTMMRNAQRPDGTKVYTAATGISLMVFYAFAMQCMSTIAVVRRETGGWKWPIVQLLYMTGLAYVASFLVYQLMK